MSGGAAWSVEVRALAAWIGDGGVQTRWRRFGCETATAERKQEKQRSAAWARNIYDRWAPRFCLTPVKPMPRFRTLVNYIGSVHPRLQQKLI